MTPKPGTPVVLAAPKVARVSLADGSKVDVILPEGTIVTHQGSHEGEHEWYRGTVSLVGDVTYRPSDLESETDDEVETKEEEE